MELDTILNFSLFRVILERGGIVMYPLFGCTILLFFVLTERFLKLNKSRILNEKDFESWNHWFQKKDLKFPIPKCKKHSILNSICKRLSIELPLPESRLKEKLQELSEVERFKMEKGLVWLNIVTVISPLLGLLGTALGMIEVFNQLSLKQNSSLNLLSKGISEALFTTVVGLLIAIPALVSYYLINRKIDSHIFALENQLNKILDLILFSKNNAYEEEAN